MSARPVLGAATAVLLTGTMLGHVPAAHAGDNDRSDWDGRRVVQLPGAPDGPVHVYGGRRDRRPQHRRRHLAVARRLGRQRLRQLGLPSGHGDPLAGGHYRHVRDGRRLRGRRPPPAVHDLAGRDFRQSARRGRRTYRCSTSAPTLPRWSPTATPGTSTSTLRPPASAATRIIGSPTPTPTWTGCPARPGSGSGSPGVDLLTFWNDPNGDLRAARRPLRDPAAAFSAPQTIATGGEKVVRFVETSVGPSLPDHAGTRRHGLAARLPGRPRTGFVFRTPTQLAGPVAAGEPVTEPQVAPEPAAAS